MQYRDFGRVGQKVSALGFGCMRLPMRDAENVDEELAIAMIRYAIDHGVNYVDTAFGYNKGQSEIVLGKALKDGYREKVMLSTKNLVHEVDAAKWWERLETQLKKLDVDFIDVYHQHGISWQKYEESLSKPGGAIEQMYKAKEQGIIGHIAFSFHDKPESLFKLVDTGHFDVVTVQYNLLDRSNEEGIAYAHEKGLGVVIMGPVAGGRLGFASEKIMAMLPGAARSTPEVALRFVLANPNVSCALSGMSTMEQVKENLEVASRPEPLSAEEREAIEAALEENKKLADLYCTGCEYCMPCPHGVNIPRNFALMNLHRVFGLTEYAKREYARFDKPDQKERRRGLAASECQECGECEPKCPQNIPIIKQLKETAEALGQ